MGNYSSGGGRQYETGRNVIDSRNQTLTGGRELYGVHGSIDQVVQGIGGGYKVERTSRGYDPIGGAPKHNFEDTPAIKL